MFLVLKMTFVVHDTLIPGTSESFILISYNYAMHIFYVIFLIRNWN